MKAKSFGKAVLAVAAAACMVAALAGCSGGSGSSSSSAASDSAATSAASAPASSDALRFVTGGETGTYYGFGGVIGNHVTNNAGVAVTVLSSDGSKANIQSIQDNAAEIGFTQADVMAYAYEGTNVFADEGKVENFSVIGALYDEQIQIVTCNPDIKSVADLKGKNVSIGAAGSGVYFNAIDILGAYGITEADITPTYQNFGDSTDALKDGKIDAAFIVAGAPTTAITSLSETKTAYLVALDEEHVAKLLENPYYNKATIKKGTYKGQDADVETVAVSSVLIARDDVPEDAVYAFTKDLFDNAGDLAHDKGKEVSIEAGSSVTTVPYHPGAAKYFKEKDIEVKTK